MYIKQIGSRYAFVKKMISVDTFLLMNFFELVPLSVIATNFFLNNEFYVPCFKTSQFVELYFDDKNK